MGENVRAAGSHCWPSGRSLCRFPTLGRESPYYVYITGGCQVCTESAPTMIKLPEMADLQDSEIYGRHNQSVKVL